VYINLCARGKLCDARNRELCIISITVNVSDNMKFHIAAMLLHVHVYMTLDQNLKEANASFHLSNSIGSLLIQESWMNISRSCHTVDSLPPPNPPPPFY